MLASSDPAAQGDSQNAGMKRPLSPSCSVENGTSETLLQENDSMVLQSIVTDQRVKKEKKRKSLTLCEVCNIQLNSSTQAQIHNNGKSHQKRLRQLNKGKTVANPDQKEGIVACQKNERIVYYLKASTGQSSPFLSSLPAFGRTLTPQLDIKHFLPLRINGGSPLSLFPNFNTMDPVQKAVINHTFGIPPPLKKKQYISCHVCHLRFNSANQAEAHFKGHKHARKLKATEGSKHKQKNSTASRNNSAAKSLPMLNGAVSTNLNNTTQQDSPEDLKEMEAENSTVMLTPDSSISSTELVGNVTSLVSPPASELSEGTPDGNMIPAIIVSTECIENGLDISITSTSQSQKEGKKSKSHLHCPVCKVTVNSASQLEAHNSGKAFCYLYNERLMIY
ncbi:zinc finger protein 385C [Protopterus annectens]|uniref:zinc finger protein 385C n=1 Tax=Protopterus annectens TaxID=7888 RepID=UPI001CFC348B|nr:zinc finger protein 385C [Protopterus annectens]